MSSEQCKHKAFLEIMTVEQMKELLRQDTEEENSQFSGDDILESMEVIERKQNGIDIDEPQTKGAAAWQDFKENYLGNAALYVPDMAKETESQLSEASKIQSKNSEVHEATPRNPRRT